MPEGLAIGYTDNNDCLQIVARETQEDWRAMNESADNYYESLSSV
jgi:hypothetical protein